MRKAKVTLIWEPIEECYIETFKKALGNHKAIEDCLVFHDGYWESKDTFDEVDYRLSEEGKSLRDAVSSMGGGVNEYMIYMTNDIKVA